MLLAASPHSGHHRRDEPCRRRMSLLAWLPGLAFPARGFTVAQGLPTLLRRRKQGPGSSDLILYSCSIYGHGDLGVNRRRPEARSAGLRAQLPLPSEK
jgi:hypothetical protein